MTMRAKHHLFPVALFVAFIVAGIAAAPSRAQKVECPAEVKGPVGFPIVVPILSVDGGKPKFEFGAGLNEFQLNLLFPKALIDQMTGRVVVAEKAGIYEVRVWNAKGDVASDITRIKVIAGTPTPVPPGPTPGPTPPDPGPTPPQPDPAPLPATGLSVLIIEETAARSTLPREQLETLTAVGPGSVRYYIADKAVKGPKGFPEFRIFDKDQSVSSESKFWQDAMALKRGPELPWLLVTNGKGGYSGPLPKTPAETLEILKKYGG